MDEPYRGLPKSVRSWRVEESLIFEPAEESVDLIFAKLFGMVPPFRQHELFASATPPTRAPDPSDDPVPICA